MLTPLTPNLLTAVCLFCECRHSPAHFFNYTLPRVLSEYIIQNEMHLENIKITNAHHYSHNFNLAWCLFFWFWLWFILYVLSIPSQMAVCPRPARESHTNCSKRTVLPPSHELQAHISCLRGRNYCCPSPIAYDEENTVCTITKWVHHVPVGWPGTLNLSKPSSLFLQ